MKEFVYLLVAAVPHINEIKVFRDWKGVEVGVDPSVIEI
jgi:hypothetical protein